MSIEQTHKDLDQELKRIKKERDGQDQLYWSIFKYTKLLHILSEAKQLVKELECEINAIKPDPSSSEKS